MLAPVGPSLDCGRAGSQAIVYRSHCIRTDEAILRPALRVRGRQCSPSHYEVLHYKAFVVLEALMSRCARDLDQDIMSRSLEGSMTARTGQSYIDALRDAGAL